MTSFSRESLASTNNNESVKTLATDSNEKKKKFDQLLRAIIRGFIRGFSAGIGVHAGYALIKVIIKRSFKYGLIKVWNAIWSKSTFRTASFLGLFPSLYRLALHYVKQTRNTEDEWNYLISGAIAGLSIISLDKNNRQTITFFSLSRAIGAGIPALVARGDLPHIPHTDIAVFSVITGVIMYSAVSRPDYLSPGYYRSIMKWANDFTDEVATKLFRTPGNRFLTCQEAGIHDESCLKHNLLDIRRGIPAVAKIYLPIHILPILIYKRKALINCPSSVIMSFLKNMASSTTFLVIMAAVAKTCLCILRNAHHRPPPIHGFIPLVSGTIGGWMGILWERKSRQRELALFNVFQILSIVNAAYSKSTIGSKHSIMGPQSFTIMFSAAMMVIMHAYETNPNYLNSITKAGLKFLVGARDSEKNKVDGQ